MKFIKDVPVEAARIKREIPVLDYFFELEKRGILRYDGKVGKEHSFGFDYQKTGSIMIREASNLWFDHANGHGGDVIKAVQVFEGKTFIEALSFLSDKTGYIEKSSIHAKNNQQSIKKEEKVIIQITKVLDVIQHPALISYLSSRMLTIDDMKGIAKEVHWKKNNDHYFAIGFPKNKKDGYAVRSNLFKGNLNGGDISSNKIGEDPTSIKFFEGGFDLASYRSLFPKESFYAIVLNSIANLTSKLMEEINHKNEALNLKIELYLDNDKEGDKKKITALKELNGAVDKSDLYKDHVDLNDFLINTSKSQKIGR